MHKSCTAHLGASVECARNRVEPASEADGTVDAQERCMTTLDVNDLAAVTGGLRVDPRPPGKDPEFKLPPGLFPFPRPIPIPFTPKRPVTDPKFPPLGLLIKRA
jgi:hypothetical protein